MKQVAIIILLTLLVAVGLGRATAAGIPCPTCPVLPTLARPTPTNTPLPTVEPPPYPDPYPMREFYETTPVVVEPYPAPVEQEVVVVLGEIERPTPRTAKHRSPQIAKRVK